jgi:uncharacterized CHY-type Zn-finger protein
VKKISEAASLALQGEEVKKKEKVKCVVCHKEIVKEEIHAMHERTGPKLDPDSVGCGVCGKRFGQKVRVSCLSPSI